MKRGQTDKSAVFLTVLRSLLAGLYARDGGVYTTLLAIQESVHVGPVVVLLNYASG